MNYRDNSLSHFGVVGMRWGVHKSGKSSAKAKSYSDDYKNSRKLKAKGIKNLSTKELQDLTTRMNLEKQYSTLNPSSYMKGLTFVKNVTAAGTTIAGLYGLTRTPLGKKVVSAVKKAMNKKNVSNTTIKTAVKLLGNGG